MRLIVTIGYQRRYFILFTTYNCLPLVYHLVKGLIVCIFPQEKELLKKKQEEMEEAEKAKRNKVVVTFDLVGRKVYFLLMLLKFLLEYYAA